MYFIKEDAHMASELMKRCSTLLDIRELQIKTTLRNPLEWLKSKRLSVSNIVEDMEKLELSYIGDRNVKCYSDFRKRLAVFEKINCKFDQPIPLLK